MNEKIKKYQVSIVGNLNDIRIVEAEDEHEAFLMALEQSIDDYGADFYDSVEEVEG